MKITPVKRLSDLKSGLYIRAVINCYGDFWPETVRVYGKPYVANEKNLGRTWKVKTDCKYSADYFCSSLSGSFSGYGRDKFRTALIPFSNKVFDYLCQVTDLREFAEAINRVSISDDEFDAAKVDFSLEQYMAEEREKYWERLSQEEDRLRYESWEANE